VFPGGLTADLQNAHLQHVEVCEPDGMKRAIDTIARESGDSIPGLQGVGATAQEID